VNPTQQARDDARSSQARPVAIVAAWLVHVYTASGVALALLTVMAVWDRDTVQALWLGLAAMVVDGTDGMLARRFRVKETIPWFDGARLDDIVDYLTYVFAPIVLLHTTDRLPGGNGGLIVAALPLLTSCYQFCRVDAKTDDHTFLGFPSYWNIVAFYAIVLDASEPVLAVLLVVLSLLVFAPIRFLYPSRSGALRTLSLVLSAVWAVTYAVLLIQYPDPHPLVVVVSLGYVGYYWGVSLWLTALAARRRRSGRVTA